MQSLPPVRRVAELGSLGGGKPIQMKVLRLTIAMTALLFVWLVVSVGVGWLIGIIFQPKSEAHFVVFWLDWHALPGLAIGLVMGVRAFRAIAGNTKKTDDTNAA